MWLMATPVVASCLCLLQTFVIYAKMVEPTEVRFRIWTRVGPSKLDGGWDPPGRGNFGVEKGPVHNEA